GCPSPGCQILITKVLKEVGSRSSGSTAFTVHFNLVDIANKQLHIPTKLTYNSYQGSISIWNGLTSKIGVSTRSYNYLIAFAIGVHTVLIGLSDGIAVCLS